MLLKSATTPFRATLAMTLLAVLASCGAPKMVPQGSINDPNEARNRKVHTFNTSFDKQVLRPVAVAYSNGTPDDMERAVENFADNFAVPRTVVNQILQGRIDRAAKNTVRFAVNTLLGFGGLGDPATDLGLPADESDFGETLHVWGVAEGPYKESYFTGPSTRRDSLGGMVDLFTNPLSYVVPKPEKYLGTAAGISAKVAKRGRYADTVDSLLYESADSYAAARSIYLQNRRFELGSVEQGGAADPYALDTEGF